MKKLKYMLIFVLSVLTFSCMPIETTEYNSSKQVPESIEQIKQIKNLIQLEKIYNFYIEEKGSDYSYIEMYRFKLNGMTYIHVQEDNGDGYGYVINVTKDSLMCARLAERPLETSTSSSTTYSDEHENWYKN